MQPHSPSGLAAVPSLRWGSHLTQFFETGDELRQVLVPYFKAGLENNESCLWVTGAAFTADDARSALRAALPDLDRREKAGQIAIQNGHEWYSPGQPVDAQDLIADLLRREREALEQGREGLRTNGNCAWVDADQWADFQIYESLVQETVRGRRMICSCSYCLDGLRTDSALEVMGSHDFVLPRQGHVAGARRHAAPTQAMDALPAAIYLTDSEGYLTYYNEAAARLWGYRPEIGKQRWCGTWKIREFNGTLVPLERCPMAVALQTGQPVHGVEMLFERPDGSRVPCAVYPTPLIDRQGKVAGGINLLIDISARRAAEQQHTTVAREMYHRINNTLATVQAIMNSTLRYAGTLPDFQASFSARIQALSRTHLMLTKRSQPAIGLRELLENELDLFADGDGGRVALSGPDLVLPERLAVPVGMAIHELATNAAKYGALSVSGGTLSVIWAEAGGNLAIVWRERNVYLAGRDARIGFGTQLLTEVLPMQIGARIEMRYESDGLNAQLIVPVAE